MHNILKSLVVIFFLFANVCGQQTKAIWVVRDALTSQNLNQIIDNAKKLKCDKIFLQLRALGKVYYPTQLNIPKLNIDESKFSDLIQKAKEDHIEIHAWLNFSYIYSKNKNAVSSNHIINKSNDAIIYSPVNGVKSEGYFLHPNDEKNLSEVKSIVKELIAKYQISGIHLDYFRYPKDLSHTSKSGRTKFIMEYGLDPVLAIKNPDKFIKQRGLESFTHFKDLYASFLRDELSSALIEIKEVINRTDKTVQLSVAAKPNPLKAKHQFYQDWPYWLKQGYCDFVVLMNYNPSQKEFMNNMKLAKEMAPEEKITIGIAAYNINRESVASRINNVTKTNFNGYSLFSYNFITGNAELFEYLQRIIKKKL